MWHMVGAGAPVGATEPCPGQLRAAVANCGWLWCGRPCTFALVQPSNVHLFIVIPIFVYLQVKIPTKLVELH
jgi:hypothetical protein